jgi:hypothetical protein
VDVEDVEVGVAGDLGHLVGQGDAVRRVGEEGVGHDLHVVEIDVFVEACKA